MMNYRLALRTVRYDERVKNRTAVEFSAPDDRTAIDIANYPPETLRVEIPDEYGGGLIETVPVELVELTEPPRVVKTWD